MVENKDKESQQHTVMWTDRRQAEEDLTLFSDADAIFVDGSDTTPLLRPSVPENHTDEASTYPPLLENSEAIETVEKHPLQAPSGVAGAVVGLVLGGPILAAIAGFGSAYAVRKDGAVGDVARGMGEMALATREKALVLDEKHRISENTTRAVQNAWESLGNKERQERLARNAGDTIQRGWQSTVNFTKKHNLIERGIEGTGSAFEWVAQKLSKERS